MTKKEKERKKELGALQIENTERKKKRRNDAPGKTRARATRHQLRRQRWSDGDGSQGRSQDLSIKGVTILHYMLSSICFF